MNFFAMFGSKPQLFGSLCGGIINIAWHQSMSAVEASVFVWTITIMLYLLVKP